MKDGDVDGKNDNDNESLTIVICLFSRLALSLFSLFVLMFISLKKIRLERLRIRK